MKPSSDHINYNCRIVFDDGDQKLVYANWLSNNDLHHWQHWHCEAGATRLYIDKELKVWSGECRNDLLGDLQQGWSLLPTHSVCGRTACTGCTDDLLTAKWLP